MKFWDNVNLRLFIIKLAIFLAIGLGTSLMISVIFTQTAIFQNSLDIPNDFAVEAPNMRTAVINSLLFGLITFLIISRKKLKKIENFKFRPYQLLFALLAILTLVAHYAYKYLINTNLDYFMQNPEMWGWIKLLFLPTYALFLGLAVFGLQFTAYFLKRLKKEIIFFIIVSILFFATMLAFQGLWTVLSGTVSISLYYVFSWFGYEVSYFPYDIGFSLSAKGGPILGINGFSAIIGKPCSGIDSLLLFTALYSVMLVLDWKKMNKKLAILFFIIGAVGMFITNILRIFLLFLIGAHYSPKLAVGLFHTNLGWILFLVYFWVFWTVAQKIIYKQRRIQD